MAQIEGEILKIQLIITNLIKSLNSELLINPSIVD